MPTTATISQQELLSLVAAPRRNDDSALGNVRALGGEQLSIAEYPTRRSEGLHLYSELTCGLAYQIVS
jgi:hypothetical protein